MKKFLGGLVSGLIVAVSTFAVSVARADHPSVHGMLLFGAHTTYASHLPMFHAPHDYQVILKIALSGQPQDETLFKYEQAKADDPGQIFTLVPEVMDLTKVIDGTKTSFTAEIYQGHFERGGVKLGSATVQITEVLMAKKLDPNTVANKNGYFVFGENGEYFAAHLIEGKPNFDAILKVNQPHILQFPAPCMTRVCSPIKHIGIGDSKLPLILYTTKLPLHDEPMVGDAFASDEGVQADVLGVIYFEADELSH